MDSEKQDAVPGGQAVKSRPQRGFEDVTADVTFMAGLGMTTGPAVIADVLGPSEAWVQGAGLALLVRAVLMYAVLRRERAGS